MFTCVFVGWPDSLSYLIWREKKKYDPKVVGENEIAEWIKVREKQSSKMRKALVEKAKELGVKALYYYRGIEGDNASVVPAAGPTRSKDFVKFCNAQLANQKWMESPCIEVAAKLLNRFIVLHTEDNAISISPGAVNDKNVQNAANNPILFFAYWDNKHFEPLILIK